MHGAIPNGLRNSPLITERLWATFASAAVRKVQLGCDLTDQELADNIGCSAQTVANARNMKTSGQRMGQLEGRTFVNLLSIDAMAIEGLLNHFGRRSVPIEAKCDTDALVSTAGAVHRLAAVQSQSSAGGKEILDDECLEIEADIDEAIESLSALKSRCIAIRTARAA